MCYVPYVAIFYSISKMGKISMVPLCYVTLRASFVQLQWWLSHSILQNLLALSCPGFFVHCIMMTGCMICKSCRSPSGRLL